MLAVVDANVWVSACIHTQGNPGKILEAYRADLFEALVSAPLLAELDDVIHRDRIAERYPDAPGNGERLIGILRNAGPLVEVSGQRYGVRDPDDDYLVETAINGEAEVIVSGDRDLHDEQLGLTLNRHGIEVLNPRQFLERIGIDPTPLPPAEAADGE